MKLFLVNPQYAFCSMQIFHKILFSNVYICGSLSQKSYLYFRNFTKFSKYFFPHAYLCWPLSLETSGLGIHEHVHTPEAWLLLQAQAALFWAPILCRAPGTLTNIHYLWALSKLCPLAQLHICRVKAIKLGRKYVSSRCDLGSLTT